MEEKCMSLLQNHCIKLCVYIFDWGTLNCPNNVMQIFVKSRWFVVLYNVMKYLIVGRFGNILDEIISILVLYIISIMQLMTS